MTLCACGLNQEYLQCCGAFIEQGKIPSTPEALMRSRYTAYTQANAEYIGRTMRHAAAKDYDAKGTKQWASHVKWDRLEVINAQTSGMHGEVEFIAYFTENNQPQFMHEVSEFQLIDGAWYYVDGHVPAKTPYVAATHAGRNDPCPCGSGKKFKKCCG